MELPATKGRLRAAFFLPLLLVPVAFLPDLGAALPISTYYFRDLGMVFIPMRMYQALELAAGRLPFWNPYVHEGEVILPSLYPPELLHVLSPTPAFISWVLSLHLPLAALAAYAFGRSRGLSPLAAFAAASVYALGGLTLSSLAFYVLLQALALAPLVLLTLDRCATRGGAWLAAAALAVALSISTMGVEFAVPAVALGLVLALWRDQPAPMPVSRGLGRLAAAVALGLGLAAIPIALTLGALPETERGAGFSSDILQTYELSPAALLQVLVPSLFGPLTQPFDLWWGRRFFSHGVPFFLSLYLGGLVLALVATGFARTPRRERVVLAGAAILGVWYALGPLGGLWSLVHALPAMQSFRFPVKGVFVAHLAAAILAARGIERLREGDGWRTFAAASAGAGLSVAAFGLAVGIAARPLAGWLSPDPRVYEVLLANLPADAYRAAAITLVGTALACAVLWKRVAPLAAAGLLVGLVVLDLARAGSGLNRQAHPSVFAALPGLEHAGVPDAGSGRLFVYPPDQTRSYRLWLSAWQPGSDLWTYYAMRQLREPYLNLPGRVETAATQDLSGFAPLFSTLPAPAYDPARLDAILPLLRAAAVDRIASLDPLEAPGVRPRATVPIAGSGLSLHLYDVLDAWPKAFVACRVRFAATRLAAAERTRAPDFDPRRDVTLEASPPAPPRPAGCTRGSVSERPAHPGEERFFAESDGDGWLVVRSTYARGWRATLDGREVELRRADGRHRAVALPQGRHEVVLRYDPPGLRAGAAVTAASALALLLLLIARARSWRISSRTPSRP